MREAGDDTHLTAETLRAQSIPGFSQRPLRLCGEKATGVQSPVEPGFGRQCAELGFGHADLAAMMQHVGLTVVFVAASIPATAWIRAENQIEHHSLRLRGLVHIDAPRRSPGAHSPT